MPRNTLILIAVLVVLVLAYFFYFRGSPAPLPPLSVSAPAAAREQQFIQLTQSLNTISFDQGIFSDSRLLALTSIAYPITEEATGRLDPFAPLPR